jgi:hypothetical protein
LTGYKEEGSIDAMGTRIEIKLGWTPNQWRRFLGRADTTPLVELCSVITDKMTMHLIDLRLAELAHDEDRASTAFVPPRDLTEAHHGD